MLHILIDWLLNQHRHSWRLITMRLGEQSQEELIQVRLYGYYRCTGCDEFKITLSGPGQAAIHGQLPDWLQKAQKMRPCHGCWGSHPTC